MTIEISRPPRDNIVRSMSPGVELRAAESGMPTLVGHFARFGEWAEIHSVWEGHFLERHAPGSFARTINNNRSKMKVLFQHGQDPQIGDKPLGPISELREDAQGAYYEVPLLDTSYNRDLLPGLEAGLYGASFRFTVMREEFNRSVKTSEHNPEGLPERTVIESAVHEFGPVTFPAFEGASAGVRSGTDTYILGLYERDPERLAALMEAMRDGALPKDPEPDSTPAGTREMPPVQPKFHSREEFLEWIQSI